MDNAGVEVRYKFQLLGRMAWMTLDDLEGKLLLLAELAAVDHSVGRQAAGRWVAAFIEAGHYRLPRVGGSVRAAGNVLLLSK
jgi:hypothetical protein